MKVKIPNIIAKISEYTKVADKTLTMYLPQIIQLSDNYPKQCYSVSYTDTDTNTIVYVRADDHTVANARNCYDYYGDRIFFQIFPLIETGTDYSLIQTCSSFVVDRYPSLTITPLGTFTTTPILFDKIPYFINNGLTCRNENDPANTDCSIDCTLQTKQIYKDSSENASEEKVYLNWIVKGGGYYKIERGKTNLQSEDFFKIISPPQDQTKNKLGWLPISSYNFGNRKKYSFQIQDNGVGTDFSYVSCVCCPCWGNKFNNEIAPLSSSEVRTCSWYSKRFYTLQTPYATQNPLKAYLDAKFPGKYRFSTQKQNARPFFFALKTNNHIGGSANLDFGNCRIEFDNTGVFVNVGNKKWYDNLGKVTDTAVQDKQRVRAQVNLTTSVAGMGLPYFFGYNISGGFQPPYYTAIVYPGYCGLTVQPGIHWAFDSVTTPNQKPIRAIGGTVERPLPIKRRAPTLDNWFMINKRNHRSGKTNNINMYLQANPVVWGDQLRLNLNNCTANFFYMPLYFATTARFRMYFKGLKVGKYTRQGQPAERSMTVSVQAGAVKKCQQCTISNKKMTQYRLVTQVGQDGVKKSIHQAFAYHQYNGALVYTTQYSVEPTPSYSSDSSASLYGEIRMPKATMYLSQPVKARRIPPYNGNKQYWDKYNKDAYYFDFKIDVLNNSSFQPYIRTPFQVTAVLVMQVSRYDKSLLDNDNGSFKLKQSSLYDTSVKGQTSAERGFLPILSGSGISNSSMKEKFWHQCIKSISVNWTGEGGSGSIQVDKYALMAQDAIPDQCIGGLRITMTGGNPNVIVLNSSNSDANRPADCIFTGFGTKVSSADSFNDDTITINLQGPQRKLTDLKLINAPFWDGDPMSQPIQWLSKYAGFKINMSNPKYFSRQISYNTAAPAAKKWVDQNGVIKSRSVSDFPRLPTASNFKRPSLYLKTGDDCFKAIKQVAKKCNCKFVIQPDGIGYMLTQTKMSVPIMCDETDSNPYKSSGYQAPGFNENLVISFSIQPYMNNLHNYIITAALQAVQIGSRQSQSQGGADTGFPTTKKFEKLQTTPEIPWAKVRAFKHQGFMDQRQMQQQFQRDSIVCRSYWLNVKVTIPGNQAIKLYDRLTMFGIKYYVFGISHNINMADKKWTTQLTLCNVIGANN